MPSEHLTRLAGSMRAADLDALLLGRPDNIRWATGAETLWLAGTRPFAPACAVVAAGDSEAPCVHLMSTTDDGIPPEVVPFERLFPMSWNPANLMAALAAIPGLGRAPRIGLDSVTPTMEQLLGATFASAQFVDGEALMRGARRVKSPEDVTSIRAAVALAEDCLHAVLDALRPGVRERELVGVFEERMASRGVTTPAFEGTFVLAEGVTRALPGDRAIGPGDPVQLRGGVLREGWEGWLSRSAVCGRPPTGEQRAAHRSWDAAMRAVVEQCRPGVTVATLRASEGATIDGTGTGHEELAGEDRLEPGMVLAIEVRAGNVLGSETVVVTEGAPERLTTLPQPLERR